MQIQTTYLWNYNAIFQKKKKNLNFWFYYFRERVFFSHLAVSSGLFAPSIPFSPP